VLYFSVIQQIVVWAAPRNNRTPVFEQTTEVPCIGDSPKLPMHKEGLRFPINAQFRMHIEGKL
jgi:hypothetical protein